MTILRDLSIVWSLLHVLVLFAFLFESRLSRRKTMILTLSTMLPLCALNILIYLYFGPAAAGHVLLLTCTLPSLIVFFLMAKNRDGRFVFTFCLVDTTSYWIIALTSLLDFYIGGNKYIFMFICRLIAFPLLEIVVWRLLRKPYLQIQHSVKNGWIPFSIVTALFYVLLVYMTSYPTLFTQRPDSVPAVIMLLILMPLMYLNIFQVLFRQQKLFRAEEESRMLRLQAGMQAQHAQRITQVRDQLHIYRHDQRHRLQTIAELIARNDTASALEYLEATQQSLEEIQDERWCANPILNAVFSAYFRQAAAAGITVEAELSVADTLPVAAADLSTVFANALENAINACMQLPPEQRFIRCKCLSSPQFMFRISNSFKGEVHFDQEGAPVSKEENHGIGTRSIAAFCEKHGAHCEYRAEKGIFTLQFMIL